MDPEVVMATAILHMCDHHIPNLSHLLHYWSPFIFSLFFARSFSLLFLIHTASCWIYSVWEIKFMGFCVE
jgi:hypothetical protein